MAYYLDLASFGVVHKLTTGVEVISKQLWKPLRLLFLALKVVSWDSVEFFIVFRKVILEFDDRFLSLRNGWTTLYN